MEVINIAQKMTEGNYGIIINRTIICWIVLTQRSDDFDVYDDDDDGDKINDAYIIDHTRHETLS